jgi:hypothetical protein
MGFFSYNCKECGHPLLSRGATDKGINEWMSQGVALLPNDGRILGEYDGYGRLGNDDDEGIQEAAWLHRACWEVAGKPEYQHYGTSSSGAKDQGWFFDDGAHDLIDPRITEGREDLLQAGITERGVRRFNARACQVADWVETANQKRFQYMSNYKDGKVLPDQWVLIDAFGEFFKGDDAYFGGTEAEVRSKVEVLWQTFLLTTEAKALLTQAKD